MRKAIRFEIINKLYVSMIPIRGVYLHLSDQDRLQSELELVLSKPDVEQTLTDLFSSLLRIESYSRISTRIRIVQVVSFIMGISSLIGVSLLLVAWQVSQSMDFSVLHGVMITLVALAATVYAAMAVLKMGTEA